jgi:hypothetical protein
VKRFKLVAVALVLSAPGIALACPVCFATKNEANRAAFFNSTMFLSLIPLAMMGAVIYGVYRKVKAHEAQERELS